MNRLTPHSFNPIDNADVEQRVQRDLDHLRDRRWIRGVQPSSAIPQHVKVFQRACKEDGSRPFLISQLGIEYMAFMEASSCNNDRSDCECQTDSKISEVFSGPSVNSISRAAGPGQSDPECGESNIVEKIVVFTRCPTESGSTGQWKRSHTDSRMGESLCSGGDQKGSESFKGDSISGEFNYAEVFDDSFLDDNDTVSIASGQSGMHSVGVQFEGDVPREGYPQRYVAGSVGKDKTSQSETSQSETSCFEGKRPRSIVRESGARHKCNRQVIRFQDQRMNSDGCSDERSLSTTSSAQRRLDSGWRDRSRSTTPSQQQCMNDDDILNYRSRSSTPCQQQCMNDDDFLNDRSRSTTPSQQKRLNNGVFVNDISTSTTPCRPQCMNDADILNDRSRYTIPSQQKHMDNGAILKDRSRSTTPSQKQCMNHADILNDRNIYTKPCHKQYMNYGVIVNDRSTSTTPCQQPCMNNDDYSYENGGSLDERSRSTTPCHQQCMDSGDMLNDRSRSTTPYQQKRMKNIYDERMSTRPFEKSPTLMDGSSVDSNRPMARCQQKCMDNVRNLSHSNWRTMMGQPLHGNYSDGYTQTPRRGSRTCFKKDYDVQEENGNLWENSKTMSNVGSEHGAPCQLSRQSCWSDVPARLCPRGARAANNDLELPRTSSRQADNRMWQQHDFGSSQHVTSTQRSQQFIGSSSPHENSPPVMSRQSHSPPVMSRQSNSPPVMSRQSNSPPVLSRQSNSPPVMSRQSNSPPVISLQNNSPPVMSRQSKSSPVMLRQSNSPSVMSRQSNSSPVMFYQNNSHKLLSPQNNSVTINSRQSNSRHGMSGQSNSTQGMSGQSNSTHGMSGQSYSTHDMAGQSYSPQRQPRIPVIQQHSGATHIQDSTRSNNSQYPFVVELGSGMHMRRSREEVYDSMYNFHQGQRQRSNNASSARVGRFSLIDVNNGDGATSVSSICLQESGRSAVEVETGGESRCRSTASSGTLSSRCRSTVSSGTLSGSNRRVVLKIIISSQSDINVQKCAN